MPESEEESETYSFLVDWFDPLPQLARTYRLKYYKTTNEAEMIDFKTKRLFLKRSPCPEHMSIKDLYLGAKVILYGRDLKVMQYGDDRTRERLTPALVRARETCCICSSTCDGASMISNIIILDACGTAPLRASDVIRLLL